MAKLNFRIEHRIYRIVNRLLITATFSVLLFSCGTERRNGIVYLYSKDKSQVITIITDTDRNERVIANGKHITKPKADYYKLDISNITELGDEVGVCWSINDKEWEMVNDKAKIIDVNIDTTKYAFRENWFKDERDIPNAKYYRKSNCFTVGLLNYSNLFPKENGSVERFKYP